MKQQEARHNAAMEKMKALLDAAMDKKTAPKKKYHEKKPPRRSPRKRPRVRYDTPERKIERSDSYQKQLGKTTRQAKSDSMKQLRKDIGIRVAMLEPGLVEGKYNHPVTDRFLGHVFENDIRPSLDLLLGDDMDPPTILLCFKISKDIAQKRRRYLLKKIAKTKNKEDVLQASKALSKRVQASLKARANHEDKSEAPNPNTPNPEANDEDKAEANDEDKADAPNANTPNPDATGETTEDDTEDETKYLSFDCFDCAKSLTFEECFPVETRRVDNLVQRCLACHKKDVALYQTLDAEAQQARDRSKALLLAAGRVDMDGKKVGAAKGNAAKGNGKKVGAAKGNGKKAGAAKGNGKKAGAAKGRERKRRKQYAFAVGDRVEAVWGDDHKYWPAIVFSHYKGSYGLYFLDGYVKKGCWEEDMRPPPKDAPWAKITRTDLIGQAFQHNDAKAKDTPSLTGEYEVLRLGKRTKINSYYCGHVSGKKFYFSLAYVYKKLVKDIFPFA